VEAVLDFMFPEDTTLVGTAVPEASDPLANLLSTARAGDRAAMRRLLGMLGPRLLRVVRGVLGPGHPELEDVLQDATVAVVRALGDFRGEGQVEGYAVRITLRAAIAARKKYKARVARLDEESDEREDDAPAPSDEVLAKKRRALLRSLLDELPEAQAEALVLRSVLGHSLEETANVAGVPANTIRSRMRLAREALKRRIEADPVLLESLELGT
jgi:RNA polymerase sigma-70 factor (ECF subfamily)